MRFPLTLFMLAAMLLALPARSTAQTPLCSDSGAVVIDTVAMAAEVGSTGTSMSFHAPDSYGLDGKESSGHIAWVTVVTGLTNGQYSYSIDASSVAFSGDGSIIDGIATGPLFSLMAQATIQRGIQLGYTPCTDTCGGTLPTRVIQAACVDRAGTGTATHFTPCGSDCCWREYTVCCTGGSATLTLVGTGGGVCSGASLAGGCEPTCAGEWGIALNKSTIK